MPRPPGVNFRPPRCPCPDCPGHTDRSRFLWRKAGSYRRKCDGLVVPRFLCRTCGTRFSRQTFRFNYRWWRPTLHIDLFWEFVSKSSMRHAARRYGVARDTVARRLRAMGAHCKGWHASRLREAEGRMTGTWVLDEMETFETDRRVRPVTVPVLIQKTTLFVVHAETAPMPPRGNLSRFHRARKERDEALYGKRRSGSRDACERTLLKVRPLVAAGHYFHFITDRKSSYRSLIRTHFGDRLGSHVREYGTAARDRKNPLFPINHTLAMMRDGLSRLVRRSWCAAKLRARLEDQLWVWICFRNYVRGITNEEYWRSPAMAAGVLDRQLRPRDLFRWRIGAGVSRVA